MNGQTCHSGLAGTASQMFILALRPRKQARQKKNRAGTGGKSTFKAEYGNLEIEEIN